MSRRRDRTPEKQIIQWVCLQIVCLREQELQSFQHCYWFERKPKVKTIICLPLFHFHGSWQASSVLR